MKHVLFCYYIFIQLLFTMYCFHSFVIEGPQGMYTKCLGPKIKDENGYYFYQYSGTQSVTKSGIKCQSWNVHEPHRTDSSIHTRGDMRWFYFYIRDALKSHCRIFTSYPSLDEPWCYTMDKNVEKEICGIPHCTEEEIKESQAKLDDAEYYFQKFTTCVGPKLNGHNSYRGTQSVTRQGYPCQRWDADKPHVIIDYIAQIGKTYLSSHNNYCRLLPIKFSPLHSYKEPYCYTTDKYKSTQECNIKKCSQEEVMDVLVDESDEYEQYAKTFTTCLGPILHGQYVYRGTQNVTKSGLPCQSWDISSPHKSRQTILKFGKPYLRFQNNYCRTLPFDGKEPWCLTKGTPKYYEYCGIRKCESTILSPPQNRKIYVTSVASYYVIDVDMRLRSRYETFDLCHKRKRPGYSSANLSYLASNPSNIRDIGIKLEEKFGNQTYFYFQGDERGFDRFLNAIKLSTQKQFLKNVVSQETYKYLLDDKTILQCLMFYGSKLHYNPSDCHRVYGIVCIYERHSSS